MAMKTIGVLGGLGPQATMDFERRLHAAAGRVVAPHFNGGYPPMVVWYCRHAPFVVDVDGKPVPPLRPDPRLLDAAAQLGRIADLLVIPSNGAHAVADAVAAAAGKPVLSMIEAVLAEVARRGWRRVGVIGLGHPAVYTSRSDAAGITWETIGDAHQPALDAAIFRTMEGRATAADSVAARAAVDELRRRRGVDGVVLGCTEIPLLLGDRADAPDLVNPAELLAEAAVRAAVG